MLTTLPKDLFFNSNFWHLSYLFVERKTNFLAQVFGVVHDFYNLFQKPISLTKFNKNKFRKIFFRLSFEYFSL